MLLHLLKQTAQVLSVVSSVKLIMTDCPFDSYSCLKTQIVPVMEGQWITHSMLPIHYVADIRH